MILKFPGYTPQVNAFSGMILAMIVITGLIVGFYLYHYHSKKWASMKIMRAQSSDKIHHYGPFLPNLSLIWLRYWISLLIH